MADCCEWRERARELELRVQELTTRANAAQVQAWEYGQVLDLLRNYCWNSGILSTTRAWLQGYSLPAALERLGIAPEREPPKVESI